jgi:hypothetical protein
MMDGQFNPFIRESTPPVVINVKVKTHENWGWETFGFIPVYILKRAWAEIDMEMIDVAEFHVTVRISPGRVAEFEGEGHEWFKAELDLYLWEIAGKYKVKIETVDLAGNELDPPYEEEADGWFGGVLRMLEALWEFICAVVSAIADAVMAALSFIIEWIIQQFSNAINAAIDALISLVTPDVNSFSQDLSGLGSRASSIEEFQMPIVFVPLLSTIWRVKEKLEDTFTVMEVVEMPIRVIIMATPVGGVLSGILSKVTAEGMKRFLVKLVLALTVGKIVEELLGVTNRDLLESEVARVFDYSAGTGAVVLCLWEAIDIVVKDRKKSPRSKYAAAAAFAMAALAIELIGVPILEEVTGAAEGLGLLLLDIFAGAFAIAAVLFFVAQKFFKFQAKSEILDGAISILAPTTSTVEQGLALVGATSTFISIAAHAFSGDWWK